LSSAPILVSRDGAIATVALNNPERLNALNKAMWARLGEVMRELSADDGLRCIDGFLILVLLRVKNGFALSTRSSRRFI
jgi:hypothetical protein